MRKRPAAEAAQARRSGGWNNGPNAASMQQGWARLRYHRGEEGPPLRSRNRDTTSPHKRSGLRGATACFVYATLRFLVEPSLASHQLVNRAPMSRPSPR
jgi:hypothetical protein